MARDIINVQLLAVENTQSIASAVVEKKQVIPANGIKIADAFDNRNNTMFVVIENTGSASTITVKKGNNYPNKMLGDLVLAVGSGINAIQLHDPARFENRDGSIEIDFAAGFTGNTFAVAKRVGLVPVV